LGAGAGAAGAEPSAGLPGVVVGGFEPGNGFGTGCVVGGGVCVGGGFVCCPVSASPTVPASAIEHITTRAVPPNGPSHRLAIETTSLL
jgi:hypothetical protein